MRWDNLLTDHEERHLPGYRDPAVVRTFDAPEALGTRFYEVRAKSALNRVPAASRMPFRWTVNPYRGCSHACAYCVAGDTPVLMADGRTKRIEALTIGDRVCGTVRNGNYRRYATTEVLDKWITIKPAYRVTLEDGTQLSASGDHRFLSDRGWKHVTGAEHGAGRRPHLTSSDKLIGTGGFAHGPVEGMALKSDAKLGVVSIEPLARAMPLYDITTGTGDFIANGVVSHNCFARPTHTYLDLNAREDFEREIVVKVNAPEVLRAELARPSWKGEHVAMGTNTDPYQWVEGRYRLMEGIWEALRDAANPASILTKSPLLVRDTKLLQELGERAEVSAAFSVPTIDEKAWRATEPHTPHPRKRLEAVAELNRAGIPTGVLVAPLIPGVNDDPAQVAEIVDLATAAGATHIGGIALHLRGEVRDIWFDWLRAHRPDLLPEYERLYRRGAYMPVAERERLGEVVAVARERARRRHPDPPFPAPPRFRRGVQDPPPASPRGEVQPQQPALF
jgi:DNA repair photolyase